MYREPGLVKFGTGASEETYIGEGNSSISGVENYGVGSVDLTYVFQNGGLSSIEELFRLTVDGGNYGYVAEVFDFALKTLETSYAGGKVFTTEALPDSNSANVVLTYSRR